MDSSVPCSLCGRFEHSHSRGRITKLLCFASFLLKAVLLVRTRMLNVDRTRITLLT